MPDSGDIKRHRGMAFFPGSGPYGKTCGDCKFRGGYRERLDGTHTYSYQGCMKFKQLTGKWGPEVGADYPACRYWEAKNAKDAHS